MSMVNLVAVQGAPEGASGVLTWWSLSGLVATEDLAEQWAASGLDAKLLPTLPSPETALARAVDAQKEKRLLARQVKRGNWELVRETVVPSELGDTLNHGVEIRVELLADKTLNMYSIDSSSEAIRTMFNRLQLDAVRYRHLYTASDMGSWLADMAIRLCHGLSLRDRGGFYFIPADCVALWRVVGGVVREISGHSVYEIPAMQSDEAVEAILTALRVEAEASIVAMEAYISRPVDETSTRGLNALVRDCGIVRNKLAKYSQLLGATLPDLESRVEHLTGAVHAVQLVSKPQ